MAYDNDKEKPDKKSQSTKQILEAFQVICRGIQQTKDFEIFEQHTKK